MKIILISIMVVFVLIHSKKSLNKKKKVSIKKSKVESKENKKASSLVKDQKKLVKTQQKESVQSLQKISTVKLNVKTELDKILRKKDDLDQSKHEESNSNGDQ